MFKQRVLTSLVLIPLVLFGVLYAPQQILIGLIFTVLGAAAYEWLQLIPLRKSRDQFGFLAVFCMGIVVSLCWAKWWLGVGLITWGLIPLAILTYPRTQAVWGKPYWVAIAGLIVLPLSFDSLCLVLSHNNGRQFVLYELFLVWAMDIGAYLVGKSWGVHRLIPRVSPGKTIEGVIGGYVFLYILASMGGLWFEPVSWMAWFALAASIGLISIVGDLFISMLKRRCAIKDTGALFPGHGGVLDRLDSLIAAAPFYYVGLSCISFGH